MNLLRSVLHSVHAVNRSVARGVAGVLHRVTPGSATPYDAGPETRDVAGSDEPVEMLPYPQLEEPDPIVERVLAAEAQRGFVPDAGGATEPRASTRAEEHGEVPLQRAERDEIDQEIREGQGRRGPAR
jgi:hypothetical protein